MGIPPVVQASTPWLPPSLSWLSRRHRAAVVSHLQRLDRADRMLRFSRLVSDSAIIVHVAQLDLEREWVLGAFLADGRLIGLAEASPVPTARHCTVHAAISVLPDFRGRGIGCSLLAAIVDRVHADGAAPVVAVTLPEGTPWREVRGGFAGFVRTGAIELCAGIRIEADAMPPSRLAAGMIDLDEPGPRGVPARRRPAEPPPRQSAPMCATPQPAARHDGPGTARVA
jgi:GNAT superfamily N-acetyltransferase